MGIQPYLYDVLSSLGPAYSIRIKLLKLMIQISDQLEVGYRTNICDLSWIIEVSKSHSVILGVEYVL